MKLCFDTSVLLWGTEKRSWRRCRTSKTGDSANRSDALLNLLHASIDDDVMNERLLLIMSTMVLVYGWNSGDGVERAHLPIRKELAGQTVNRVVENSGVSPYLVGHDMVQAPSSFNGRKMSRARWVRHRMAA